MISFAGGGANSRGTELFFANADVGLGGAKHETPFGVLVGEESFRTLDAWYKGYGELQVKYSEFSLGALGHANSLLLKTLKI